MSRQRSSSALESIWGHSTRKPFSSQRSDDTHEPQFPRRVGELHTFLIQSKKYLVILILLGILSQLVKGTPSAGTYENSLVVAPLYTEYPVASADVFAREAQSLKSQLGT